MTEVAAPPIPAVPAVQPLPVLTPQEKETLRQRVLAGQRLDLETSKRVVDSLRGERRSAAEAARAAKPKSNKRRKKGMTDAELDADLDLAIATATGAISPAAGSAPARDLAPDLDIS